MKLRRVNIAERILHARNKRIPELELIETVREIFDQERAKEEKIMQALQEDLDFSTNHFEFDLMESSRIFHYSDIEKICIHYRLRFLNTSLFKGDLPYEAIMKIKELEKQHNISLKGFKIVAPASLLKLENADDPLLFVPVSNDYYYLIHTWGRDLHPLRKLLMWPFRYLENFMLTLLVLSVALTALVPIGMFSKEPTTTEFFMLLFFMFKWVTGLALFYGFKNGKNFSSAIWRSKYYNG